MPPGSPLPETVVRHQEHLQRVWLRGVALWQARQPRGQALGNPLEVLQELQGALWLELQRRQTPLTVVEARRCLRRVLYREFESPWAHSPASLLPDLDSPLQPPPPSTDAFLADLPAGLQPFAHAYLDGGGPEGNLKRAMEHFGSRRKVRIINTLLLQAMLGRPPLEAMRRRAARLCVAVAASGVAPHHRREARAIRRALAMLEPTPEGRRIRQGLSGIAAARTAPDRAGNPGSASACTGPRATARGR